MVEFDVVQQPFAHRVARRLGLAGVRGARAYWGLAARISPFPGPGIVRLGGGLPLALDPEDWSSRNSYMGLYERSEVRLLPKLLAPGDTVVDVGANVGYLAALFAKAVGPAGRVVGFEPSPRCLEVLHQLSQLPDLGALEIHGTAIGAEDGEATLQGHTRANHSGGGSLRRGMNVSDGEPVRVRRLDSVLPELAVHRVALLKIDVEGLEAAVLRGASRLFAEDAVDSVLVEVTPVWGPINFAVELVERLRDTHHAFVVEDGGRFRSTPSLVRTEGQDLAAAQLQFNLLLVRRRLVERVASAIAAG